MEERITVYREILSLGVTMQEGLEHLMSRMGEGHFEDTHYLFGDILDAFRSISDTMISDITPDVSTQMQEFNNRLQAAFDNMNQYYENNKMENARMDMQFVLFPAFKAWIQAVDDCLRPLIQS